MIKKCKKFIYQHKIFFLFLLFFFIVLLQHQFLWMYHDDYGYASLSYLFTYPGQTGMNTDFMDIISFLIYHYNNWGGRIVYFFIEIILLKLGLPFFRLGQSLVITLIFYFIYRIIVRHQKKDNVIIALCTMACYGIFEIMVVRSGIMWASASVLYVFPLLPFLGFIYLYDSKKTSKINTIMSAILLFLASWSQEQIAVLSLVYIGMKTIIETINDKKISKKNLVFLLISIFGFSLLMLAPGSFARLSTSNGEFSELSLLEKIKINLPTIITSNFGNYTKIFSGFFFFSILYFCYSNLKNKTFNSIMNYFSMISIIVILLETMIQPEGYFQSLIYYTENRVVQIILLLLICIQLLFIVYSVITYFWTKKEPEWIYLFLSSVASQAVMLVAPYFPLRSTIMFEVVGIMFILYVICEISKKKRINSVFYCFLSAFFLICGSNFFTVSYGYYTNHKVNFENDYTLREVSKEIKQGKQINEINLKKLNNPLYTIEQPYDEGYEYIKEWIKKYYDLPSQTVLIYE